MSAPPVFNMQISATQGATIVRPTQIVNYYPSSPQASRFQVPPLPAHFVHRDLEAKVKTRCLEDGPSHAPSVLALHGMGGIGKSTLAAAVAGDPEVARRFPDGIFWAELKQEPDLSGLLAGWVQGLGDYAFQAANAAGFSTHLRSLLHDKAVLLIVDDVWEAEHARPFLVGGPRSRTMITTRRTDVADELGAELIELDPLSPEQSLELLAARLSRPIAEGERDEALAVARELGHLPMALEQAAVRVARRTSWLDLLRALAAEIAQLEALEGPHRQKREQTRLQASFQLSLNALRAENEPAWRAFCELGILAEDATITAPLVATLCNVGEKEAAGFLELLWNDALLSLGVDVRIGGRTWHSYRLHNLLHDTALYLLTTAPPQGLGRSLPGVHADLIDRYAQRFSGGELRRLAGPDLPDDGYVHAHLLRHLEKSGRIDDLHALLAGELPDGRNGWFEARDRLGQAGGYLEDVARAWDLAANAAAARLAAGEPAPEIALEVRYALITATLHSIGGNVPAALVARLLQEKIWSPEQALAYSKWALIDLAPHLPASWLRELVTKSLSKNIQAQEVELLGALVPHLPSDLRQQLFAASQGMQEAYRWSLQLSLVPYLDEPEKLQVLAMISGLIGQINEYQLVNALRTLVSHLPESKKSVILETLLRHWDGEELTETWLAHLLVFARQWLTAPETLRSIHIRLAGRQQIWGRFVSLPAEEDVAQMTLDQFRKFLLKESPGADGGGARDIRVDAFLQILVGMVPLFTSLLLRWMPNDQLEAWFVGRLGADASLLREFADSMFVQTLDWCAPQLSAELLDVALERARAVRDPYVRLTALSRLLPHLGEAVCEDASAEVVPLLQEVEPGERLSIFPEVAAYAPEPLLEGALAAVAGIADDTQRARLLASLVPRLPSTFQARAVLPVRSLQNPYEWIEVYAAWLPAAPEALKSELVTEVLAKARAVEALDLRAHFFAKLAPHLPEDALPEALGLARQLENRDEITELLQALSPRLPGSLLPQALEIARGLRDDDARSEALENLGPVLLHAGDLQAALRTVRAIPDDLIRVRLLAVLARHASADVRGELLREALETARKISIRLYRRRGGGAFESRTAALAGIAGELPEPEREALLSEALDAELEQGAQGVNSPVVADLGLKLAEAGNVEQALKAAGVVTPEPARVWVLAGIAERLPEARKPEVLAQALAGALAIEDTIFPQGVAPETERDEALADLAPRLVKDFPEGALQALEAIHGMAKRVEALVGMALQLAAQDRAEALETCQRTLAELTAPERARALAKLAGVVPEASRPEMLRRALAEIRTIGEDRVRSQALGALAPQLDEASLPEARALAADIADPDWREQAQLALIQRLSEVGEPAAALEELGALTNASFQAQCLRTLAPRLDVELQRRTLLLAGAMRGATFYRQDQAHRPSGTVARFPVSYQAASVLLDSLALHLRPELRLEAYRVWSQTLQDLAPGSRDPLLRNLQLLGAAVSPLGGTEAVAATARSIEDVGRWWP